MPSNVLPLHLKQTFPPKIWIFTEGVGDGIESRLSFKIFSTLQFPLLGVKRWKQFQKKFDPIVEFSVLQNLTCFYYA